MRGFCGPRIFQGKIMVKIPPKPDPTLLAIDLILEDQTNSEKARDYLGASSIGDECSRRLWLRLNGHRETFKADTIRKFNSGHRCEDVMAAHLRMVDGVNLLTHDGNGKQYGWVDGQMRGHYDGLILGLLQAPKTWHVWENKETNEKKFSEFKKLAIADEKSALEKWNKVYYAQAVINMHKAGLDRHYMTVCTPGMRDYWSCRTEANPVYAEGLLSKGKRIAGMTEPPERIGGPDWWQCKMCGFYGVCHKKGVDFMIEMGDSGVNEGDIS